MSKFIDAHRNELSIQMMCRLLGVARAGYYAWREHPVSYRAREDALLPANTCVGYYQPRHLWCGQGIFFDLRERRNLQQAAGCSLDAGERIARIAWLSHTAFIPTSKPHVLIPNLLQRQFTVSRPNEAWVTDITYIRTWEWAGCVYGRCLGYFLTQNC